MARSRVERAMGSGGHPRVALEDVKKKKKKMGTFILHVQGAVGRSTFKIRRAALRKRRWRVATRCD